MGQATVVTEVKTPKTSTFEQVGQLLGFVMKDGEKIKYLRLVIHNQEYWLKVPKSLRKTLDPSLYPGCWVKVSGTQKRSGKTGKFKYKAIALQPVFNDFPSPSPRVSPPPILSTPPSQKAKILICQKSNCRQRGGSGLCSALDEYLRDRGLENQVQIKATGCLNQCKKGPAMVVLPDKAKYTQVTPRKLPQLLNQHFNPQ
ncbi:(2Fe-2S) ferredoxin domain-containing protein [Spirulina subsalsa]|uniref:(2Fe-2S) ferredoxin domain-containing protein n=1 Tax=Spirulina subsalsa TaxID=54311 RepID=UPI0002DE39F8|nr:(2Fe-2S) ferredoxin domain-containing protein [Spirulina subsalsa]